MSAKRHQQGFIKPLFTLGAIAFIAIVGIKLFPLYANQFKLAGVVKDVAAEGSVNPQDVQKALNRRWDIEDIQHITPKEVLIDRGTDGGSPALTYEYQASTPLFYNISLVIDFKGRERVKDS